MRAECTHVCWTPGACRRWGRGSPGCRSRASSGRAGPCRGLSWQHPVDAVGRPTGSLPLLATTKITTKHSTWMLKENFDRYRVYVQYVHVQYVHCKVRTLCSTCTVQCMSSSCLSLRVRECNEEEGKTTLKERDREWIEATKLMHCRYLCTYSQSLITLSEWWTTIFFLDDWMQEGIKVM